jgi:serine phosphatase RsbU (regulator of sigma subunit)
MQDLPAKVSESLLRLVDEQRFLAHIVVDENNVLVRLGGQLAHYGLADLSIGIPASDQLPFLEGMLPLFETPFLIRSLGMPGGPIADVHFFADGDVVWVVLLDMTAEHDEAQLIQQKAYDMTLLSEREARLIAQLEAANNELVRAHRALADSQEALLVTHNRLQEELGEAERYVRSSLPEPMTEPFVLDWLFEPTTELGGDSFGYHWVDGEHFAFYLLDVCGHGIGAALLSVAANQTLRSKALPGTDFLDPASVLGALNLVYQMDRHNDMYFTIWYGVYHPASGTLRYATAGHPAPVLVRGPRGTPGEVELLAGKGPILGMLPTFRYTGYSCEIRPPFRLYVFSDGTFEISRPDGSMLDFAEFQQALVEPAPEGGSELERLLEFARRTRGEATLEDDFSIMKLEFDESPGKPA